MSLMFPERSVDPAVVVITMPILWISRSSPTAVMLNSAKTVSVAPADTFPDGEVGACEMVTVPDLHLEHLPDDAMAAHESVVSPSPSFGRIRYPSDLSRAIAS